MQPWRLVIAAMLIGAWVLTVPALAAGPFDGEWQVTLTTMLGPCQFFNFPMTIRDGAMRGVIPTRQARYEVTGHVLPDGNFTWGWGHATGKLSENAGSGQWVTTTGATAQSCSGYISLQRERQ